ncbi:MAG: hypothetical protein WD871_02120 [Xanthobacteraceae bacterium]
MAQGECKDGTRTTATGTIAKVSRVSPTSADIFPAGKPRGQCAVSDLTLDGRPLPAGCVSGRKFTASGKMGPDPLDIADGILTLYVDTIRCE